MSATNSHNYHRIASAIKYLNANFRAQPSLDEIAAHVHLSPFHFQRLFKEWAGVSPKKFLQFLSIEYAKDLLRGGSPPLSEAAYHTGLSGTGRLHDLFINIEAMTPAEYRNGGAGLRIEYSLHHSAFGQLFIAATGKGICQLVFAEDEVIALADLRLLFPNALCTRAPAQKHAAIANIFDPEIATPSAMRLHLKGTPFQLKVWQALLRIPSGNLSTYGQLAKDIEQPGASRAVGTAIGKNPVAFLIPCHRVIRASGVTGGYRWGPVRKQAIIGWEGAQERQ
ncbi:MAG: bifunctional transcriptional activator/DNA repair enzyme AdaA [Lewinella sp.]